MNKVTHCTIQATTQGTKMSPCFPLKTPYSSFQNSEEGVAIIEEILKKNVLCRHDVERVNHIYQAIDRLERKVDKFSDYNTHYALKKVIEKIQKIACDKKIGPSGLISLYHLQHFSGFSLEGCFDKASKKFDHDFEALATLLPVCDSEDQFKEDVLALIGQSPGHEVCKILELKREKILNRSAHEKMIQTKKSELNSPTYYDELLHEEFFHLYDHLTYMRSLKDRHARKAEIEKMTLSSLSHVVLQTRLAIIQKVARSIPKGHQNVLFLLGGSGAGKSTLLCYLRKDEMILNEDFCYTSKNDKKGLIGHGNNSCTFLPTIEVINDWTVIDFPGFEDTNGQLISLGMEFAIKALIKRYTPKVLVLESISNTESAYAAVAQLGWRLEHLLGNHQDCVLGLTKYALNPFFRSIKNIEESQIKEQSRPSQEESKLTGEIRGLSLALSTVANESLQKTLEAKKIQLKNILEKKPQEQKMALPETKEKTQYKNLLIENEKKISKEIGFKNVLTFENFEISPSLYFEKLSKEKNIHSKSEQSLEPEDKQLLTIKFQNNLVKDLESQIDLPKNLKNFKQNILESSLIFTIFSSSHPEIGHFLHLPEMDLALVRKFDKEVVEHCIKKFSESVIKMLDMSLIELILEDLQKEVPNDKISELKDSFQKVKNHIELLVTDENIKEAKEKWKKIRNNHQNAVNNLDEEYKLPTWVKVMMGIALGIPYGIQKLMKWNAQAKVKESALLELIKECCRDLDQVHTILLQLKSMEKLIDKHAALDLACAMPVVCDSSSASHNSLIDKIDKVRASYGEKDWDDRVSSLSHQFVLTPFDANNSKHVTCLLDYAYLLIEPQVDKLWKRAHNLQTPSLVNFSFFEEPLDKALPVVCVLRAAALLKANGDMLTKLRNIIRGEKL